MAKEGGEVRASCLGLSHQALAGDSWTAAGNRCLNYELSAYVNADSVCLFTNQAS